MRRIKIFDTLLLLPLTIFVVATIGIAIYWWKVSNLSTLQVKQYGNKLIIGNFSGRAELVLNKLLGNNK